MRFLRALCLLTVNSAAVVAQGLNPEDLLKAPASTWPTYNGDYSGRRYSPLSQINASNVRSLALQWVYRTRDSGGDWTVKAAPLVVNGILYFTVPNNVWAIDARTGREIWHFKYPKNPAWVIGNRGLGMYGDWLFFESPDNYLISLNAKNGKERWRVKIADVKLEYFSTMAPLVIRNHIIVGVGGDSLDNPGYLESHDPETGALQWRWNAEPQPGQPGSETWPNPESMAHGGGMTWMTGTYDPELNLLYWGTGNPNPVHAGQGRKGDNLWTCSIVALNPDTGKLAWYFQPTPHDTHDWDATQTPVLIDGEFAGVKRKLLAQANRNGYFFLLDRTNGTHLLTVPFVETNWSKGINAKGVPVADVTKEPTRDGTLVSPSSGGATNWFPPSFNPDTGFFYLNASQNYSVFYLTAEGKAEGFAGRDNGLPGDRGFTLAIDYKTGKICWRDEGGSNAGLLSTGGNLLFTGDSAGHLIALDASNGHARWHANTNQYVGNGPITYQLDEKQYVVFGSGDSLYAFALPSEAP